MAQQQAYAWVLRSHLEVVEGQQGDCTALCSKNRKLCSAHRITVL
jgi:hypothetical protein